MQVRSIRLHNFRAHAETTAEFTPRINLVHGPNGSGKTNLLEAVHYACLSKSFITASDAYVVRKGATFFEVEAKVRSDRGVERRIRLAHARGEGKRAFIDGAPLNRLSDLVGMAPVVVYSPEDHALTAGGPDERRRLLNNVMSQERPIYMDDLAKYRRAVRQRNELLLRGGRNMLGGAQEPVLLSWTAEYVSLAARIVFARAGFVRTFNRFIETAYALLGETVERPSIQYRTFDTVENLSVDEIAEAFRRTVERNQAREREQGRTLIGPHRDDLDFRLNDFDVRRYASQGQHRTFGMALKIAQYLYLKDRLEEHPVLLLDDVFGNLDPHRTGVILRLLQSDLLGQTLITATHPEPFLDHVDLDDDLHRRLCVSTGEAGARVAAFDTP